MGVVVQLGIIVRVIVAIGVPQTGVEDLVGVKARGVGVLVLIIVAVGVRTVDV
jgi:hypothetical protein